jgi:hypothetical protein
VERKQIELSLRQIIAKLWNFFFFASNMAYAAKQQDGAPPH